MYRGTRFILEIPYLWLSLDLLEDRLATLPMLLVIERPDPDSDLDGDHLVLPHVEKKGGAGMVIRI